MAIEMISEILKKSNENDVILFERGYYSVKLFFMRWGEEIKLENSEAKRSTMFREMMQQIKREVLLGQDMDNVLR